MSTSVYILLFIALIFVLLLINGKLSKINILFSGFTEKFLQDITKTPEGAEAVYNKAIEDEEKNVAEISDIYKDIIGTAESLKNDIKELQNRSKNIESTLLSMSRRGDLNINDISVISMAEEKLTCDENIKVNNDALVEINVKTNEIREVLNLAEKNLIRLRSEKTSTINKLKTNNKIEKIYDAANRITSDSTAGKMINQIKEGVNESSARTIGARIVHENSLTAKLDKAHKQAIMSEAGDYLKSIANKK